ncbi:hypothetical protein AB0952_09305 [Streptomyces caniferus]|uniref:hypothetical protein n=1 Tax=Streptomyces caniferus TaxID=285557 RepID=UPI003454FA3F
MNSDMHPWAARWSFNTCSGVTADASRFTSMEALKSAISGAAERALADLTEAEGDAMDESWNRFIAAIELDAEPEARRAGRWQYQSDGWAEVEINFSSV